MKEEIKNIFLMGLGAMSMTSEKAKEMKEELLKKGQELYESGRVANEELKHNIKEKIKDNVIIVVNEKTDITKEDVVEKINEMSDSEKQELINLLTNKQKEEKE